MSNFLSTFNDILAAINNIVWHDAVLYIVLGTGVLFTFWSGFCQYQALTHGVKLIRGGHESKDDPGAISHLQALSAALSATVGLGNIGGVAVAIALGGPGAIFWMWVVGFVGMALKTAEVTQSMLFRNVSDSSDPHGGPMWVVENGIAPTSKLRWIRKPLAYAFCLTLLISTVTGGNMFQAWNVGVVTQESLGIPTFIVGVVMAILVGLTILGGIKRIGAVAELFVPFMCITYLLATLYVIAFHISDIPSMLKLIVSSAFNPAEAGGAFIGATSGLAILWGMKRALFSCEAGQGSSPIAHSAAKTKEPVREGVVAGLEPFIDTLVVCTLTSLVILSTGSWNRPGESQFSQPPQFVQQADGDWSLGSTPLAAKQPQAQEVSGTWVPGDKVFALARYGKEDEQTGTNLHRITGTVQQTEEQGFVVAWDDIVLSPEEQQNAVAPVLESPEIYKEYVGAALTSHAFDRVTPGLGKYLVLVCSWLFAVSTMISWSYYGEQGVIYMIGKKAVFAYRLLYCLFIIIACSGFISNEEELDNITALGTGVMLWANIPIMLLFGRVAMKAYKDYFRRMKAAKS